MGKLFTTLVGSPLKSFVLLRGEVELAFEESHFILDLSLWSTLYPVGIPCGKSLIVHGSPKKIFPRGTLPWRIIYLGDMCSDVFFILANIQILINSTYFLNATEKKNIRYFSTNTLSLDILNYLNTLTLRPSHSYLFRWKILWETEEKTVSYFQMWWFWKIATVTVIKTKRMYIFTLKNFHYF